MRNFLSDLKISTKISILVVLTLLLMSSVIGLGLRQINVIGKEVKAIAEEDITLLQALGKITFHNLEQLIHLERAVQFGKRMVQEKTARDNFEIEKENFLKHSRTITLEIEKNRAFIERMYEKYKTTRRRKKRVLDVDYELRSIDKECAGYQFLAERVFNLLSQGKLKEAEPTIQKITGEKEEHIGLDMPLGNLTLAIEGFAEDSIIRAEESKQTAIIAMSSTSFLVLLFSLSLGIFIARSIKKPLLLAVDVANQIAEGERKPKIQVSSKDETGLLLTALKDMSEALSEANIEVDEKNRSLEQEIAQRSLAQKMLEKRIKELNCLYGLSKLIEKQKIPLEQILQEMTELIRKAYRYPDVTCVRITFDGIQYKTDNFKKSEVSQYAPIEVRGEKAGTVEVYYPGEKAETGESPFLKEEHDLLDALAERLGRITERKRAGEKIKHQNEFLNNILESLTCPFYVIDANDYTIKMANPAAWTGKLPEKATCYMISHKRDKPCDGTDHICPIKEVKKTGKAVTVEHVHHNKDGNVRNVEVHGYPIFDNKGNVVQMIEYTLDITEHKQAEEALRESQKLFVAFMGHLPGVAFMKDAEGRYLYMNEICEKIYDVKSADWEGKTDDEIWPADIAKNLKANDRTVMAEGEVLETVEELPQSDGIHHWLTYKFPLTDEHDKPVTLAGVAIDITQRMEVEKKLLQVQAAVDDASDAIIITDCQGRSQYSNIGFGELFKHSNETINEAGIGSIFVDENVIKKLPKTILGADSWKGEVEMVSSMGRQFPAFLHGTPIRDEQANILGMLFIINDITELKESEREQARLLEKVESTNKELKDFAHIISHDLKAPLRGVSTLANWISTDYADKLGEEGKEQIDLLLTRVERMHKLIDGILQYSRAGRVKEKQIRVNLNELVEDVIDMVAPPGNIEITIEDDLPVVECGQTRLIQVFQNLLSNAVKYTDKPQGRIKIGCVEEYGFWKFSVADNGPGIEEKHFGKIFRIFQTLSPRDEFESTGVGLTVVKKIVELYGGRIWVESKLGEGSAFFFTLPKQKMGVKDAKLEANIVGRR